MHVYVPYDLRDDIENQVSDERLNRNFPVMGNRQHSYRARNMYVHSTYMNIRTYMCMYIHYYSMHRYEHNVYAYACTPHTINLHTILPCPIHMGWCEIWGQIRQSAIQIG